MKLSETSRWAGGNVGLAVPPHPHAGTEISTERVCSECGAAMVESDRLVEDGAVFIWYTCTQDGCMGQWLTKKALRMCGD